MTTAEGGAVAVGSEEEWALLKSLSNQGRSDDGGWLTHSRLGYNYRIDDLSAALGLAQLERLDEILAARDEVAARYGELLAGSTASRRRSRTTTTIAAPGSSTSSSWPPAIDRNGVIARLARRGSRRKPYLPSIHLQPFYRERFGYREGTLPVRRTRAPARSRFPSTRACRPRIRSASSSPRPRPRSAPARLPVLGLR